MILTSVRLELIATCFVYELHSDLDSFVTSSFNFNMGLENGIPVVLVTYQAVVVVTFHAHPQNLVNEPEPCVHPFSDRFPLVLNQNPD